MLVLSTPESPLRVGVVSASAFAVRDVGPDGKHAAALPRDHVYRNRRRGDVRRLLRFALHGVDGRLGDGKGGGHPAVARAGHGAGARRRRVADRDGERALNTDILSVTTAPPAQYYLTDGPSRFAVTLFHADGTTPDVESSRHLYRAGGRQFQRRARAPAARWRPTAPASLVHLIAVHAGTYTVQASFGSLTQAVTFTVIAHHWHLKVLSAPADNTPTGVVAAQPFHRAGRARRTA